MLVFSEIFKVPAEQVIVDLTRRRGLPAETIKKVDPGAVRELAPDHFGKRMIHGTSGDQDARRFLVLWKRTAHHRHHERRRLGGHTIACRSSSSADVYASLETRRCPCIVPRSQAAADR
jgi:hypothetical protein